MLEGFEDFDFDGPLCGTDRTSHKVYVKGEGPPLIVWQELPGIVPATLDMVDRLVADGYKVYLPHLFGPLLKFRIGGNLMRLFCMRKEFHLFAAHKSSPITQWMRALCQQVQAENQGQQVGTIGMCLTGGFALTLMVDDAVIGGVAAQPSMPLFNQKSLHMSADEIADARAAMRAKGPALAMRYEGDVLCKAPKLEAIKAAFGGEVITHTIKGKGHALLSAHWSEEAYGKLLDYFNDRFQMPRL